MRFEGTLVRWDDRKGCGYLESTQGGEPIFIHISSFRPGGRRPSLGDSVSFEVQVGPKGKRAASAELLERRAAPAHPRRERPVAWGLYSVGAILALLAAYVMTWMLWGISHKWAVYYLAFSLVTAVAYLHDKSAARRGSWRVSEQTLHLLGLLGGWPGGLFMQKALRHKSSKKNFQVTFWLCVALNLVAFVALNHPNFKAALPRSVV